MRDTMDTAMMSDLVRRASSICGLAVVLDAEAFVESLRRAAPHADVRAAEITYVSLRPQKHCRVGYSLDVSGTPVELDVRAGLPNDVPRWRRNYMSHAVRGPLGPGRILFEDRAILVNVFPNDPKLPEVQNVMDDAGRAPMFRELFPDRPEFWDSEFHPMRYRPERRFVARLRTASGEQAVMKCCTARAFSRSKCNATAFQSIGPLRVARLLGSAERRCLLAHEWLPGRPLFELYTAPEFDQRSMACAGAALAVLHHQRPEGLAEWTRDFAAAHVAAVAAEIGFTNPRLAGRVDTVARRLQERLPRDVETRVPIHGDISSRHLLVDDGSVGIIDLDWACNGDAADDLGYLIAHAERLAARERISPGRVVDVREALLEGYGGANDRNLREQVDVYTGVGLLQQTRFPFRAWAPDWPESTEQLLSRTEVYANGRG